MLFRSLATIHLTPVSDPSAFGVVGLTSDNLVGRFVEKPSPGETDSNLINAGTYVMEPEVLSRIERDVPVSVERTTFPALVAEGALAGYPTKDSWIDTGRPEFYLEANLVYADREDAIIRSHVAVSAEVVGVVADGTRIDEGASVRNSVLLPGSVIESGCRVENSLVWGRISAGASVIDCVIGEEAVVPAGDHHGIRIPDPN